MASERARSEHQSERPANDPLLVPLHTPTATDHRTPTSRRPDGRLEARLGSLEAPVGQPKSDTPRGTGWAEVKQTDRQTHNRPRASSSTSSATGPARARPGARGPRRSLRSLQVASKLGQDSSQQDNWTDPITKLARSELQPSEMAQRQQQPQPQPQPQQQEQHSRRRM